MGCLLTDGIQQWEFHAPPLQQRCAGTRVSSVVGSRCSEDVDVIGLSCLSGAHLHLFPQVTNLLRDREARDILVFGGGAIPDEDIPNLPASGIQAIFTPGTSTREAITGV